MVILILLLDFPCGSDSKESACSAEDLGSISGLGRALEEVLAAHSSILAWRIPWTEEPSGLQSMGSQRVGHDRTTKYSTCWYHTALNTVDLEFK